MHRNRHGQTALDPDEACRRITGALHEACAFGEGVAVVTVEGGAHIEGGTVLEGECEPVLVLGAELQARVVTGLEHGRGAGVIVVLEVVEGP